MGETNLLTGQQTQIKNLVKTIKEQHAKEFTAAPYDGLLLTVHKDAFKDITAYQSLAYEITKFGDSVGTGSLHYMTPGPLVPLFPTTLRLSDDNEIELLAGTRFLDKVFILSGSHYLDKSAHVINGAHCYDEAITAMASKLRKFPNPAVWIIIQIQLV